MHIKIAILDMYDGYPNQGMKGIQDIIKRYSLAHGVRTDYKVFDVRGKNEVPDTSFDVYISSGGPGSPIDSEGSAWENNFFALIDELETINKDPNRTDKKYGFFICHSFQLLCRKYRLGNVVKRKSTSFGIFPVHKTDQWDQEEIFSGVDETFFVMDSRDWQVIEPDEEQFHRLGAKLLAIEKERAHVDLERCMMAIRFNDYFIGTQFHPEADPVGMKAHLLDEKNKDQIMATHGQKKYYEMLQLLDDPATLELTRKEIIPSFLQSAVASAQVV